MYMVYLIVGIIFTIIAAFCHYKYKLNNLHNMPTTLVGICRMFSLCISVVFYVVAIFIIN